ncbi:TPA: EamA/RhaT family transporter, partial [Klebsiella pneumoniae]|nr:EamA/RhaT family transporter [Klebsiella pneumoniae]
ALLYGFIYSQRIPDLQETAAILLLLGGVLVTVHYHQLSRRGYAGNSPEVKGS